MESKNKLYYLIDVFSKKEENKGRDIGYILTTYKYFNNKDRIVSTDYKERYTIDVDRPNKTITLKSVNSDKVIKYMKNEYGKYEEVE